MRNSKIDLVDVNLKIAIAFGVVIIAFFLAYLTFFR